MRVGNVMFRIKQPRSTHDLILYKSCGHHYSNTVLLLHCTVIRMKFAASHLNGNYRCFTPVGYSSANDKTASQYENIGLTPSRLNHVTSQALL